MGVRLLADSLFSHCESLLTPSVFVAMKLVLSSVPLRFTPGLYAAAAPELGVRSGGEVGVGSRTNKKSQDDSSWLFLCVLCDSVVSFFGFLFFLGRFCRFGNFDYRFRMIFEERIVGRGFFEPGAEVVDVG